MGRISAELNACDPNRLSALRVRIGAVSRWCRLAALLPLCASGAFGQLIAYYSFNDGTANDSSGHGYNATYNGATYTASGYAGGAFTFSGAPSSGAPTSYIQIDSLNINPSNYPTLTMGAWVATNEVGSIIRQVISHDDGSFDRSLGLDYRGSVTGWSTFVGAGVLGGQAATVGAWTFLAVAYNQTANTAMLYVNGSTYTYNSASNGTGWSYTRIGSNPSFVEYFNGTIDEVFFFSSALTAAQLDNIRLNGVMAAVPEPSATAVLLGLLAIGAAAAARRDRRR